MKRTILFLLALLSFLFQASAQQTDSLFKWSVAFENQSKHGAEVSTANMIIDADNNVYYYGHFYGSNDFDPGPGTDVKTSRGQCDLYITKFDSLNNYVSTLQIGNEFLEYSSHIKINGNNEIIISGHFVGKTDFDPGIGVEELYAGTNYHLFCARYTVNGNFIDVFSLPTALPYTTNASATDHIVEIEFDSNGNIILLGNVRSSIDFDPGSGINSITSVSPSGDNVFIAKYSLTGNLIFVKSFGGIGGAHANDLAITGDNKLYIAGIYSDDSCDLDPSSGQYLLNYSGSQDGFLAKYSANGDFMDAEVFDEILNNTVRKVIVKSGFILSVLHSGSDDRIIEMDTSLSGISATIFDPNVTLTDMKYIGNVLVTTGALFNTAQIFSNTYVSMGTSDPFITIGNSVLHFIGGPAGFTDLIIDHSNDIHGLGFFNDSLDCDPSIGIYNLFETTSYSALGPRFKIKFDSNGSLLNVHKIESQFPNAKNESGLIILQDSTNNIYVSGSTRDSLDIQYGTGTMISNYTPPSDNYFIAKLDENGTALFSVTMNATIEGMQFDKLNNLVIFGTYQGSTDIDPGPGIHNITSYNGSANGQYLATFDLNGNFISAINFPNFGVTNANLIQSICFDQNNDLLIGGFINSTNNFDLTGGTLNFPVSNNYTPFFAKYIGITNVFVKVLEESMTSASENKLGFIRTDSLNRIYIAGIYDRTVDFDPGAGIASSTSISSTGDYFFGRYDSSGNLQLIKTMGSASAETLHSFCLDSKNNFILGGFNSSAFDFDLGTPVYSKNGAFVVKYDSLGNFVFHNGPSAGSSTSGAKAGAIIDRYDNVLFAPTIVATYDMDPSPFITNNVGTLSNTIPILCKYDPEGNLIYGFAVAIPYYNLTNAFTSRSFSIDNDGNIVYLNNMNCSADMNPSQPMTNLQASLNGIDMVISAYEEDICSNFNLQIDTMFDISCQFGSSFAIINEIPNLIVADSIHWNTSPITFNDTAYFTSPGIYSVTVTNQNGCTKSKSFIINGPNSPSDFDLQANLITDPFRVGFPATITLDAFNDGCVPITGELSLVLDPLLVYNSANPAPDQISGDTLIWNFIDLTYDSLHMVPEVYVTTSTSASIGDMICLDLFINPISGDMDSSNNIRNYCFPVINGYDPNNKYVNPTGLSSNGYILSNQRLTYTINFQNTGNSEAINVFVTDTLDSDLDLNTLDVISSSHPMVTEILSGNILKFKFDNIHLPDSSTNEPASHGYIIYEIDPASPYDNGIVNNTANIFFDFNPVVITNTTLNIICEEWPILATDLTPANNLTVCQGSGTTLLASGNGTINWYDENMNFVGSGNQIFIPQVDSNSIFYAFDSTCYSFPSGVSINVNVISLPDNTVMQNIDTLLAVQSGATYQWINCTTGLPISGANNQQYIVTSNGDYAVILSQNNCSDTSLCVSVNGLGISGLNSKNYRLNPNPTNGSISIQTDIPGSYWVEILDLYGQILYVNRYNSSKMELTLSDQISSGMYIARIISVDGSTVEKIRFIYQK